MIRFCGKLERQWLNFVDWRGTSDGAKAYAYQKPWFVQKAFNPFKGIVFNDNSSIAAAEGIPIEQDPEYQRKMEFEKKKKEWEEANSNLRLGRTYEAEGYFWTTALGEDKKDDFEFTLGIRRESLSKMYKKYVKIKRFLNWHKYANLEEIEEKKKRLKSKVTLSKENLFIVNLFRLAWPWLAYDSRKKYDFGSALELRGVNEIFKDKPIEEYIRLRRLLSENTLKFRKLSYVWRDWVYKKKIRQRKVDKLDSGIEFKVDFWATRFLKRHTEWDGDNYNDVLGISLLESIGYKFTEAEQEYWWSFMEEALEQEILEDSEASKGMKKFIKGYTKHILELRKKRRHKDYDKVLSGEIIIKTEKEKLEEEKKLKAIDILEQEKEKKEKLKRVRLEEKRKKERPKQKILDEIFEMQRQMRKQRAWFFSNRNEYFETWEFLDKDYITSDGIRFEVIRHRWIQISRVCGNYRFIYT